LSSTRRHIPTTEESQENNYNWNEDVLSPQPSLSTLQQETDATNNAAFGQQFFGGNYGGGGGGGSGFMDVDLDSWGSISKMLQQRYNSGFSTEVTAGERNKQPFCIRPLGFAVQPKSKCRQQ